MTPTCKCSKGTAQGEEWGEEVKFKLAHKFKYPDIGKCRIEIQRRIIMTTDAVQKVFMAERDRKITVETKKK